MRPAEIRCRHVVACTRNATGPGRPAPRPTAEPRSRVASGPGVTVLYLDNHLLVVDKPAGRLVQGDATGDPNLVTEAKAYLKDRFDKPGNVFVGLVHRLDRPTSGVVVLARTSKAAGRLSDQFRRRTTDKRYLAVLDGVLDPEGQAIDGLQKADGSVRIVDLGDPGAQRAALRWRTLAVEGGRSLVDVHLETGRKHQIRAQLAARGAPVLGDFRYGSPREPFAEGRGIALHAWRLGLEHPTQREPRMFEAPPPPSWSGLFDQALSAHLAHPVP